MSETKWVSWDDSIRDEADVKRLAVQDLHNELLLTSVEIGGICNMAHWASQGMAARVHQTGKRLRDLTVWELMDMLKAQENLHANIEWERNRRGVSS